MNYYRVSVEHNLIIRKLSTRPLSNRKHIVLIQLARPPRVGSSSGRDLLGPSRTS